MTNKFNRNVNSGFTLIELLVVIAIIGILSSVVLASLNTARSKGADAAIKSNLNNIRAQAELVYDNATPTNSYAGVCVDPGVVKGISAAASAASVTWTSTANNAAGTSCNSNAGAWAVVIPLKAVSGHYWCVDSTGQAVDKSSAPGATVTACP